MPFSKVLALKFGHLHHWDARHPHVAYQLKSISKKCNACLKLELPKTPAFELSGSPFVPAGNLSQDPYLTQGTEDMKVDWRTIKLPQCQAASPGRWINS